MKIISNLVEVHLFREKDGSIEFLLLKRSEKEIYPGLWQMVSGNVEEGEMSYQAALREIKEETGLDPEKFWIVPNVNQFYSPENDSINLLPVFAALIKGEQTVRICEEHCDWGWYTPIETKKLLTWDGQRRSVDIIVDYFTQQRSVLNLLELKIPQ